VQRRGQSVASEPGGATVASRTHRDVEPILKEDLVGDPEAGQERLVGGATSQEHVLAVVDVEIAPSERVRHAAQAGTRFQQGDPEPGVGAA